MRMYYEDLARGGGRSEGVRKAQLAMLRDPARSHPYYWAPFLLSGSGASLSGAAVAPPIAPKVQAGARGCGCEIPGGSKGPEGGAAAALSALAAFLLGTRRRASGRRASPGTPPPSKRGARSKRAGPDVWYKAGQRSRGSL